MCSRADRERDVALGIGEQLRDQCQEAQASSAGACIACDGRLPRRRQAGSARVQPVSHAIRILASAWTRILWRCWQDRSAYDVSRHRAAQVAAA